MPNTPNWLNRITGRRWRYTPPPNRTDSAADHAEMSRRIELAKYWEADYQRRLAEANADADAATWSATSYDRFATAYDWIDSGAPDLGHAGFIRRLARHADALVEVGDLDMAYHLRSAADLLGEQARDDEWNAVAEAMHAGDRADFIEQQRDVVRARVERFLERRGIQLPPQDVLEPSPVDQHESDYEAGRRMQRERGAERAVQHAYEMRMALAEENSETTSTWLSLDSLRHELEDQARQSGLTSYSRDEIDAAIQRLVRNGADDGSRFHLVTDDTTGRAELMFDDRADILAEQENDVAAPAEVPPVTATLDQTPTAKAGPDLGHDRVTEHLLGMAATADASGEAGQADRLRQFAETVQQQAISDEYVAAQLAAGSDEPQVQIEDARDHFRRWLESTSRDHGIDVPADLAGPDNAHSTEVVDSSDQLTESAADGAVMMEPPDRLANVVADQDDERRQELDAELEAAEYNEPQRRDEALARQVDELAARAESSGDVERASQPRILASDSRYVPHGWDGESAITAEPWQIEAGEVAEAEVLAAREAAAFDREDMTKGTKPLSDVQDAPARDEVEQIDDVTDRGNDSAENVKEVIETSACSVSVKRAEAVVAQMHEHLDSEARRAEQAARDVELARWHAEDRAIEAADEQAIEDTGPVLGDDPQV